MYFWVKRVFDFAFALIITLVIVPLLILIAALVKFSSSGPVFFAQERLGKDGRKFLLYKFRTMTNKVRISHQEIMGDNPEVTRIGYWLRRFKLDELPQLLNVLNGDMSIVGPRPSLPDAMKHLNEDGLKRLRVRPGLTGLAQVNGNIHLSWEERWQYDAAYVDSMSLLLDLKILAKTVLIILLGEDRFVRKIDEDR